MLTLRAGAAALAAACVFVTATVLGLAQPAFAQYKLDETTVVRISLPDLKKQMAAGTVVVVDVRDAASYAQGHIPGAWLIPAEQAAQRTAELKKLGKMVVTYCSWPAENSSARAALPMIEAGIKTQTLLGGWAAWVQGQNPIETGGPKK